MDTKIVFTGDRCPRCRSGRTIPIIYGLPIRGEMTEMANRGEIELGGRAVGFKSPKTFCTKCGYRFK